MTKANISYILLFGFSLLAFILGCSTEKNTVVTRAYHNLTAKYNVYFNANDNFKRATQKTDESYKDNYSRILPVFTYSDDNAAKTIGPDMDKTLKKASKCIKYHSIKAKPKYKGKLSKRKKEFLSKNEYCNWVDDSYLLMGKALFYKHDYFQARQNFEYVMAQFKESDARFSASLWLTRAMIETGQYNKARENLDLLDGDKEFPKKLKGEFDAIYADLYLKQKNYEQGAEYLRKAIAKTRKKRDKTRYKFILAQIYQQMGEFKNATNLYTQVLKMNPKYEMAFNAKINQASCFEVESGNSKKIKDQLQILLKDEKNKEYLDQIYFALANVLYKEGSVDEAVANYKLSLEKNVGNTDQRSLSYLALANIYFKKLDYKPAQAYYDSTVSIIDKKHPDFDKIYLLSTYLNELVENINTIQHEDSVQRIAKMSEKDRLAFIDNLIEKVKQEEARKKEEEAQLQKNIMFDQQNKMNNPNMGNQSGKWYFYNTALISQGFAEFKRKWGNRKLDDFWRRKNKAISMSDDVAAENGAENDSTKGKQLSNKTREFYLKGLPLKDSLIAKSNQDILDSYFRLGKIYKEKMNDFPRSIEAFEAMNIRFPKNEFELISYYELYNLNAKTKNQPRADYYKSLLTTKYPDSKYAKLIVNPNYINELMAQGSEVDILYKEAYHEFNKGNYTTVIKLCNKADSLYKNSMLTPNFAYFKAVAVGRTTNNENLKKELGDVIRKYPESEIVKPAQDILTYLKRGSLSDIKEKLANTKFVTTSSDTSTVETPLYSFTESTPHYYVIIVNNSKKIDANRLSFNVSNFNIDYYGMSNYNVSSIILNKDFNLITVKSFGSKKEGMEYFKTISANPDVFKDISPTDFRHFVISSENFAAFYKDQDIAKYLNFFNKKYQQ